MKNFYSLAIIVSSLVALPATFFSFWTASPVVNLAELVVFPQFWALFFRGWLWVASASLISCCVAYWLTVRRKGKS